LDDPKGLSWWLRRIHPEDRDRVSDAVKLSTDNNKQSWEEEYRFKCADGTYKHMRDKGFIVYENELPVKMIGSLQDVTDVKNLENALLEEKLMRQKEISETAIRVQEKERTRIGHELHDNVNQLLSTSKLFVDMLTPSSKEEMTVKDKSIEYIVLAIEEIRKLSRELVTPQFKDKKLVDSIQQLIDDLRLSTDILIKFTYDLDIDLLSTGKKVTFFRIVQEQIKNVLKYSKAEKVDIHLLCKNSQAILTIHDNGIGFDIRQPVKGIGLSNIQERARFYNGEVKIESAKGRGCTLQVILPLHDQ
ncbi:MAG TPA: PAS domain-containing protein, partial [Chitinophagaceae bacterium]|nr:PAS domain-containing protein [Chitinophagaceae bacterium]